jgi:hypothetical protein
MQQPNRASAGEPVDDSVDARAITKSKFVSTRSDARHWPGQRHRKHVSTFEPRDRIREITTHIIRPIG